MKDQNFVALDLELNNYEGCGTPKIIEVGVAIGSPFRADSIRCCSWYLDPGEPIAPFITKLTGITDSLIESGAVTHQTLASELGKLIEVHKCFANPVTWGQGDARELKAEFAQRSVPFPFFGRRIIDVKERVVFAQLARGVSPGGGLRRTLNAHGLKFEGQPHRAADDAKNTLRLFFHLLQRESNTLKHISELSKLYV